MRQLDVAHKIIAIMAGLIAIYTFVSRLLPSLQLPTRWSDSVLPLAVLALALVILYRGWYRR